ncbi:hypothetical protein HOK68_04010 [Candidatus Woesearchaeota archaeon]|jgi:Icc-related predicted phosphoesterase|nr:hypothetical protein [Candidatus Woesearchaeota archaeon]MBT4387195.1 hypothetical protein [Candidatus Woesearchaeota archaeon]MBT4596197.1 hypothetical protein [Candidatus Woesearchaeota archaeon]MBT5741580.1 hypothetical protein [Candidatus Woesearchaeota archaeon]MBT6505914.1 hypothetical protein [Candidatus Woesearchaeota archaeon]
MRIIYAITDMHVEIDAMKTAGKLIKKYGAEVCLCCGDYSWFGQGSKESLKILNDYSVKTYIIHGNHEMLNTAKNDIKDFKNLIFIHKKSVIFKDLFIIGYGGGGFAQKDAEFLKFANLEIKKNKKKLYEVLMIHGPPFGTLLDIKITNYVGNKDFSNFISNNNIEISFSGHIHEGEELHDQLKNSIVTNPGYRGLIYILNSKKLSMFDFEIEVNNLKQFKNSKKIFLNKNVCLIAIWN